jgi:thioredoxin-like negative regulator of GroEL
MSMKLKWIVCAAAWAFSLGSASARAGSETAGVPWQTSVPKAAPAALAANKPLLLEFWADWCPPCKVMDEQVYSDATVVRAMTKVVPVRIDVDKQQPLVRKYEIASMPTLLFADSYGNELFRFTGVVTVDTMTQLLRELPGDMTNINRFAQILADDKNNFSALDSLGRELKADALFRASNVYYERATRVRTAPPAKVGEILIAMGHNNLELKEFRQAAQLFDRYLQNFKGGPAESEAMLGLGRALLFQDKRADAKRTLQALVARQKSGPFYDEATRLLSGL